MATNNLPAPPEGAHWEFKEVSTNFKKESLGERPILIWDEVDGARKHYGDEGVCDSLNGTSLLVSYQGIARRITISGQNPGEGKEPLSDEEIDNAVATAILEFRPGKRAQVTPAGAAARQAKAVAEQLGDQAGDLGEFLARLKAKIAAGETVDLAQIEL
jgi:hypothetical protein